MAKFLNNIVRQLDALISTPGLSARERYLSESIDTADVERRIREIERASGHSFWN